RRIPFLYKKTDSTMRGNIGAELTAMLKASGRNALVFVPAFPRMGRTVKDGIFRVGGELLSTTSYARDPFQPVVSDKVVDIVRQQTELPVRMIDVATEKLPQDAPEILVCDAQSEQELEEIAQCLAPIADKIVLAGCAGFAAYVASYIHGTRQKNTETCPEGSGHIMLCGSINERTRQQVLYAKEKGMSSYRLRPADYLGESLTHSSQAKIGELSRGNGTVLLYTADSEGDILAAKDYAAANGMDGENLHLRIAQGLGRIARYCISDKHVGMLSVIGGDTLFGAMQGIKPKGFVLCREALPGVILSRLVFANGMEKYMLSKAGSFGEETVLWDMGRLFTE
ncbi:MAG: four-carbon acid sugar kinase family protein, partial [Christensenella sp.]|uniref:four-carbon acid sugar kinase family protein n=1 Tax=Christensenella sp. TaxID=1935934 RepID=UPI002B21629D